MPNRFRLACARAARAMSLGCCLWLCAVPAALALEPVAGPPIDPNAADAATLAATLPGIGPVKAQRIVAHRERHGPFADVDALLAVRGIGPVTLERLRARLRIGGAAAPGAPAEPRPVGSAAGAAAGAAVGTSADESERAARLAVQALVARALADADARGAR